MNKDKKKWKIPLYKIFADNEDVREISKVIKRKMDWAIGPEIKEFETKMAKFNNTKFCVAFNSGTSAGHAALISLKINSGEIIVPSFTFISTSNWPLMVNAKPKFVDIEEERLGLDPQLVEKSITKRVKAIIPVHFGGVPCKIDEISKIARKKKIIMIEDAAESLGAKINGKMTGNFGDVSIFSFAANKIITTGEGGMVCTNSKKIAERLELIRSHGRENNEDYFKTNLKPDYISLGYNWRMSSMTAALGLSQLDKVDKAIKLRRKHADFYSKEFRKIEKIRIQEEPNNCKQVYQFYNIFMEDSISRDKLQRYLNKKGIMTKIFFEPIHLSKFYKKSRIKHVSALKKTESISKKILSIPMYPGLLYEERKYIVESIKEFFE